jgi:hypothetical protein
MEEMVVKPTISGDERSTGYSRLFETRFARRIRCAPEKYIVTISLRSGGTFSPRISASATCAGKRSRSIDDTCSAKASFDVGAQLLLAHPLCVCLYVCLYVCIHKSIYLYIIPPPPFRHATTQFQRYTRCL